VARDLLFPSYESYLHTLVRNFGILLSTHDNSHTENGGIYASPDWGLEATIPMHVSYSTYFMEPNY
jgi:hypothetical protein